MIFEPKPNHRHHRKRQLGQSLIETSISMMILLLILMGILDIGRLYFIYIALSDTAGEGAMYLSIFPHCVNSTDGSQCGNPNNAMYRIQHASGEFFDWTTAETTIDVNFPDGGVGAGSTVEVIVKHKVTLLTPLIPPIAGTDTITLTSRATQIILSD